MSQDEHVVEPMGTLTRIIRGSHSSRIDVPVLNVLPTRTFFVLPVRGQFS